MPSYRGLTTVVFTTDIGEQDPFASDEPHCSPIALYILATCWCRANLSDGEIPAATLRRLAAWSASGPSVESCAARLVESGLWTKTDDGCFVDETYSDMQVTSKEICKLSADQRKRRLGMKKNQRLTGGEPAVHRTSTEREPHILSSPVLSVPVESIPREEAASPQSTPSASTGAEEGRPRKQREKKPAHPNYKPTLDAIDAIYREATGSKPDWSSPKERAAVDRLAKAWPLEEIQTRARRFWIEHLPGFAWQGKVTVLCVADFASHFPRLAVIESRNGHYSNGLPDDFVHQRVY